MFRYIGLAWDNAIALHSEAAGYLGRAIQERPGWRLEILCPGLKVFTTGSRQGANGAYPLPPDHGVILGKLFRRRDLDSQAASDPRLSPTETLRIVQSGGRGLVDDYWGRYVAFIQEAPGRASVLRDPSGALPCFRIEHLGVSIVFSWLEDILACMPSVPSPTVNWTGVAAHILFHKLAGRDTALDGVQRVLPGEAMPLSGGASRPELLWDAAKIARDAANVEPAEAAVDLRDLVRHCTRSWANCHDHVLLRLSGGLDSSILVSCLDRQATSTAVTCLNYHSPGADSDERQYARLAADRALRRLVERERDIHFRLERTLDVARTTEPASYLGRMGTPRMDAALAAEVGATAMLTGTGGDQLFFELRCCWPAADYLRVRGLRWGLWAAAMDGARLGRVSVWEALRVALTDRIHARDPWDDAGRYLSLVNRDALPVGRDREPYIHPALLPGHGLPIGKASQTLQLLHPLDYYDPFEVEAAPEAINPLLSQPLIELCLRLPTFVLTHGGRSRGLAREAFANDLPPEIVNRRSKGGMEEHIGLVLRRSLEFARGLLLDGYLVKQGILDGTNVEQALSGRPTTLAANAHEIHVYIGIEAWLRRWLAGQQTPAGVPH